MHAINWLTLQPQETELQALCERIEGVVAARKLRRMLVETILQGYPWLGRADLIPFYHPSHTYSQGQWVALPVRDPQKIRPTIWEIARVDRAQITENPVQGSFQVLTLKIIGKDELTYLASSVHDAKYDVPDLSTYSPEDLAGLSAWVAETYAGRLQTTLETLVKSGQLRGRFVGENFIPGKILAVALAQLEPFLRNLSHHQAWVSVEEIFQGLPELSHLTPETAFALIRSALDGSSYRSLGGDRWTTPVLFEQLNREVPRGLPGPHIRSKLNIWTAQDEQDLAEYQQKPLPAEARRALEELDAGDTFPESAPDTWRPPPGPLRLPTLNYLHITQAYFPVNHIIHAFAPEVRLVFIQFIEGDHQPFLLDRENGLLKALEPELLYVKIHGGDKTGLIPAGTYLWLEYQGGENYRIAPRPLPFERMVPCKQAYIENGELRIKHIEIPMCYEGDPSVFKADMRFEDIEALFAEARRVNLSVRDAIIYAVQKLCNDDPQGRAHRLAIFNAVFLKRMCSPNSVSLLLYTLPCFVQLGSGYFCYNPSPKELISRTRARHIPTFPALDNLIPEPAKPEAAIEENPPDEIYPNVEHPLKPVPGEQSRLLTGNPQAVLPELGIPQVPVPGKVEVPKPVQVENETSVQVGKQVLPNSESEMEQAERGTKAAVEGIEIMPKPLTTATDANLESESTLPPAIDLVPEESMATATQSCPEYEPASPEIPTRPTHPIPFYLRIWIALSSWFRKVFGRTP